jgi:two-component system alkaline phosphatase synthesis response regulator PhoP
MLELSPREFQLLCYFIDHQGEVVSREQLLDAVWGYDTIPFTRTVDTHIAKLRKKIEDDPSDPRFLITVHRLGYKFVG